MKSLVHRLRLWLIGRLLPVQSISNLELDLSKKYLIICTAGESDSLGVCMEKQDWMARVIGELGVSREQVQFLVIPGILNVYHLALEDRKKEA